MTTDKPEVAAYLHTNKKYQEHKDVSLYYDMNYTYPMVRTEPLIRLSDYERLQAECEQLRKHLQHMIDQTTPLEPDPDHPGWSRRIKLDEVIAERDQLRAECEQLRKDADQYRRLIELGEDFQWENIIRIDIEDFPSRAAAIDAAMQGRQP